MWYNVNYNKLVLLLTPTFLRKDTFFGWIKSVASPLSKMYDSWFKMRSDNLYKLAHNGQVCYLRKSLNDRFDPSLRRIYIGDGNKYKRQYIYTRGEQKPKYLGTMYLHSRNDYADTGVDFIVFVPASIVDAQIYELEALIDFYKEGVKRYKIVKI
ncbi:MAG: hypothetical protein QM487_15310 [Candidatus Marithrix sp.]